MRLITNHLALLNNIWKRKMILYVTRGILYTVYLLSDAINRWSSERGWVETQCLCVGELERGTKIASATFGPIISETTLVQLAWLRWDEIFFIAKSSLIWIYLSAIYHITDERFSDPTLSHYSADYFKLVSGCRRNMLTYEIKLADAISHNISYVDFNQLRDLFLQVL